MAQLLAVGTLVGSAAVAQVPFPPDALISAPTQPAALAAIGANQAELSTHLLLDAPEITSPGGLVVVGKSFVPGTSQMVLLRVSRTVTGGAAQREKPYLFASRISPGKPATIKAELDAATTLNLVLLAQARGKWFYVTREVKVGRTVNASQ